MRAREKSTLTEKYQYKLTFYSHNRGKIQNMYNYVQIAQRRSINLLAIAGSEAVVRAAGARRHFVVSAKGNLRVAIRAAVATASGFFAGLNNVFVHFVILLLI